MECDSCFTQVMTAGQRVSFEYHGNNYTFTVNRAALEEQGKSNGIERGMISNDTYIVFETSNASGIKVRFLSYPSLFFVFFFGFGTCFRNCLLKVQV